MGRRRFAAHGPLAGARTISVTHTAGFSGDPLTHRNAEEGEPPIADPTKPAPATAPGPDVLALVRLMLVSGCVAPENPSLLTNEAAVDGLSPKPVGEAGGTEAGTRTAIMALRDLVWRVDTARVLIEPRLDAAGCAELAELLSTEDIHALLREIS